MAGSRSTPTRPSRRSPTRRGRSRSPARRPSGPFRQPTRLQARVLARPRACRRRDTPTGPARPRARACGSSSVSAGTVESASSTIQSLGGLEVVLGDEPREQRVVSGNPRTNPVAQITCSRAVHASAPRGTGPRAAARASGSSHRRPGRIRRGEQRAQARRPLVAARAGGTARGPRWEKYWRGTLSGRRSGSRRRTDTTSAPAASAFSHSVAAASPAPTTVTRRRVLVRLVGVHDARVAAQLLGDVQARDARRDEHVPEAPCPSSSKPPSTARICSTRRSTHALVPAAPLAQLARRARGTRRPSGDSGRAPIETSGAANGGAGRSRTARPGNDVGEAVAVALRAHLALPDRLRARRATRPPDRRRSRRPRSRPARARRVAASGTR